MARIQCKHDFEANWLKVPNFIPMKGEFIIYDKEVDVNGMPGIDNSGNVIPLPSDRTSFCLYDRVKIGDGNTPVYALPFMNTYTEYIETSIPLSEITSGDNLGGQILTFCHDELPTYDNYGSGALGLGTATTALGFTVPRYIMQTVEYGTVHTLRTGMQLNTELELGDKIFGLFQFNYNADTHATVYDIFAVFHENGESYWNEFDYSNGNRLDRYKLPSNANSITLTSDITSRPLSSVQVQKTATTIQADCRYNYLAMYPVGSIYMSTLNKSPASFYGGTWKPIAAGRTLYGAGDIRINNYTNRYTPGETIDPGLPNIKGDGIFGFNIGSAGSTGAIYVYDAGSTATVRDGTYYSRAKYGIDANQHNTIYSDDVHTVQPAAYVVYMWERIG